jgi:hypothetical protein
MSRLLAVVTAGQEAAAGARMAALAAVARAERATVRLASVRPVPRPRVDAFDAVVISAERTLEHVAATVTSRLEAAARATFDGTPVETVVRFGDPVREALLEADSFAPDLVALFALAPASLAERLRLRALRRRLARRSDTRVVILADAETARAFPRLRSLHDPRWRHDLVASRR